MAGDSSFDVVSKVDRQEVDNALNQAAKEISQRYDFKGVGASIEWSGETSIVMKANSEDRVKAVLDVFETKLVKRGVSLKALDKAQGRQGRLGRPPVDATRPHQGQEPGAGARGRHSDQQPGPTAEAR